MPDSDPAPHQGAMSVEAFCRWASIGRTVAYREIAEGRLHVRKLGRRTLIPVAEAERWLTALPGPSTEDAARKPSGYTAHSALPPGVKRRRASEHPHTSTVIAETSTMPDPDRKPTSDNSFAEAAEPDRRLKCLRDALAEEIERDIRDRRLPPGTRLEMEFLLATRYGVDSTAMAAAGDAAR